MVPFRGRITKADLDLVHSLGSVSKRLIMRSDRFFSSFLHLKSRAFFPLNIGHSPRTCAKCSWSARPRKVVSYRTAFGQSPLLGCVASMGWGLSVRSGNLVWGSMQPTAAIFGGRYQKFNVGKVGYFPLYLVHTCLRRGEAAELWEVGGAEAPSCFLCSISFSWLGLP